MMWEPPVHPANEEARLAILSACHIMDTPRDARFDRLAWLAQSFYQADVAFLSFVDADYQWMKSVTSSLIASSIERRRSVCQHIIATGEPLFSVDLQADSRFSGHPVVPLIPFHFYAGVPLIAYPDLTLGTLCVMRKLPAPQGSGFDFAPLQAIAAIAIDELDLWQRNNDLAAQSRLDALTRLMNRRGWEEALARQIARCNRTGESLAILFIDIDHFKQVNDRFGHDAGDILLQKFAAILADLPLRTDDVLARYGGEEFVMALPGCDLAGARQVAGEIRRQIADSALPHPQGCVTASIGIAVGAGEHICAHDLLVKADAAMYAAKNAGRDCIMAHDSGQAEAVKGEVVSPG